MGKLKTDVSGAAPEEEEDGSWSSFFGKFNCGFKNVFHKAGEVMGSVGEKINESGIGEKVTTAGAYVFEKGKDLASSAYQRGKELTEDDRVQRFASNTSQGFSNITEKMKSVRVEG